MRTAFTLLELLVVVAIVSLLAALLFPVFAQAKTAAKRTVSLNNVKQITLAQFLYMEDNEGSVAINRDCTLVIEGRSEQAPCTVGRAYRGWIDLTVPYVKNYQVFKSPGDEVEAVPLKPGTMDAVGRPVESGVVWGPRPDGRVIGGEYRSSYARNNNWSNNGTYTARYSQAEFPATLILIYSFAANSGAGARDYEGVPGSSFTIVRRPSIEADPAQCVAYTNDSSQNVRSNFLRFLPQFVAAREAQTPSSERYLGRGIYGFADGHAKAFVPDVIRGQCNWGISSPGLESGNDGVNPDFRF